jgi:hypothetical protein
MDCIEDIFQTVAIFMSLQELSTSTSLFNEPLNLAMSVTEFGIYVGKV